MTRYAAHVLLVLLFAAIAHPARAGEGDPTLVAVEKIWDQAPHNAFTDLIRFNDRWVCAFREAPAHKGGVKDSRIRVIESGDTKAWTSVGELKDPRGDIRDAKMAILPDGRLMLLTATQLFDVSAGQTHQSIAFFTRDLKTWEGPLDVAEPNFWPWGIKFHKGIGYSIGYGTAATKQVQLFKTADGAKFERVGEPLKVDAPFPNENAIYFDDDDTARLLLRCDPRGETDKTAYGYLGSARPPYTDWTLKRSNLRVGGPALTRTPDARLLGAGRLYDPKARMSLFWIDEKTAAITECLSFPSGGDCSYPGLVWHDGALYVSYYSSHEGKTSIYLARVNVPASAAAAPAKR
jgi:hypothetical protein